MFDEEVINFKNDPSLLSKKFYSFCKSFWNGFFFAQNLEQNPIA